MWRLVSQALVASALVMHNNRLRTPTAERPHQRPDQGAADTGQAHTARRERLSAHPAQRQRQDGGPKLQCDTSAGH